MERFYGSYNILILEYKDLPIFMSRQRNCAGSGQEISGLRT